MYVCYLCSVVLRCSRLGNTVKDSTFGYAVFIITMVLALIFLLSGCVSPSKYDVELANRQNDNMLNLMDTIENQEDMMMGFMMILEKRITMMESGTLYQLAPNLYLADTPCPQYLEPVE